jgi:phosphonate transport system substrate-binding protein
MKLFKSVLSTAAALTFALTAPFAAVYAQDASPVSSPAAPAYQHVTEPQDYDKSEWPDKLTCGLFGGDDSETTLENNAPIASYLSEWLGIPVEYTTGTSYNAVIEAARAGRVDCYQVGPFAYILGVQEANAEALAINVSTSAEPAVFDPTLQPYYYSVISTVKGSGVESLTDLQGGSFAFVDPASTSGHLIPRATLIAAGMDPDDPATEMNIMFAGSHPTSGLAIANGRVDAGATTENTVRNMWRENTADICFWEDGETGKERSVEDLQQLYADCPDGFMVPIAYSDPIPSTPFAINKDMPESLKQAIKDALLATPQDAEFIEATGRWYVDPNLDQNLGLPHLDNMYDPLRDTAEALDLDLKSLED